VSVIVLTNGGCARPDSIADTASSSHVVASESDFIENYVLRKIRNVLSVPRIWPLKSRDLENASLAEGPLLSRQRVLYLFRFPLF
jgi:hypothetical protein